MRNVYGKISILAALATMLCHVEVSTAELRLPSATQRQPTTSPDPFERLRQSRSKEKDAPVDATSPSAPPSEQVVSPAEPPPPIPSPTNAPSSGLSHEFIIDIDYVYKLEGGVRESTDEMGNTQPGTTPPQSVFVGLAHYIGELDTQKAGLWDNGTFLAHIISGFGETPTVTTGDLRSVSNIDAAFMDENQQMVIPTLDLVEAWYQHQFPHNKSSLRVGVLSYGFEFYKTRYSGLFLHSAFGIGTEVLWDTMVSNPPTTSVGIRLKTEFAENRYLQIGVYDGFPDHSTDFFKLSLSEQEGFFAGLELGFTAGKPKTDGYYKYGIGGWYLKQDLSVIAEQYKMITVPEDEDFYLTGTSGFYVFAEKALSENTGVFAKGGTADEAVNKYSSYFSIGVWHKGFFESRPSDVIGFGIAQSNLGATYLSINGVDQSGQPTLYSSETIYELSYSIPVNDWLTIQPDLQFIDNPGFSLNNDDVWVLVVRGEAVF